MDRSVLLLANPNAGRVDDAAIGVACRAVPADVPVEVAVTRDVDEVPDVLDRVDGRLLLVLGGDGTLNVTIGALHRAGVLGSTDVGFVPAGTANAFARALGLPLDVADAVPAALAGDRQPIDLLVSDAGHVAVNDLHTGLGVPATRLSRRLKPLLRQGAYPVANALAGLRTPGWGIEVVIDGVPLVGADERCLAVMVGNTHVIGDGTVMWPDARPDDGLVDVVVLLARDRWTRIGLGLAVHRAEHVERADVRRADGTTVELRGQVPGHNADGELHEGAGETSWRVERGAWWLRCLSGRG